MQKKVLLLKEAREFERVLDYIHIPKNPPNLVLIAGPCRVGTTALSNVFAHAGNISYMQPIKSIRRAIEEGVETPEFYVDSRQQIVVCKETFGAKNESEYFDPVEILLKAGYPKEKLFLITIVREPAETLTSWTWMWEEVLIDGFIRAYRQTDEVRRNALRLGIRTISYAHEAIRDNRADLVVAKLFNKVFGKGKMKTGLINWERGPNFDSDKRVKFFDEPPERFVHAVKTWGSYEYRPIKPELTVEQERRLEAEGIFKIYGDLVRTCESDLEIKIQKSLGIRSKGLDFEVRNTGV